MVLTCETMGKGFALGCEGLETMVDLVSILPEHLVLEHLML